MDEVFDEKEKLYRAVYPPTRFPNFWKKNGRVSSAAFKKKDGLSVERGNFRETEEVIRTMKKDFEGNILSVYVKACNDVGALVKYLPTNRSIFHSEIHSNKNVVKLTDRQAKYLADNAVLEYEEKAN